MSYESARLAGGRTVFSKRRVMDLGGGAAHLGALRLPRHTKGRGSALTKNKASSCGKDFSSGVSGSGSFTRDAPRAVALENYRPTLQDNAEARLHLCQVYPSVRGHPLMMRNSRNNLTSPGGFFVNDSFFVLTRAWHSLRLTTHSRPPCMSGDRLGERPGASCLRAQARTSTSLAHRRLLGGS